MMEKGLLHSPPEKITQNHPELFEYVETCADSSENRFETSKKLIKTLQIVIDESYVN